MRNIEYLGNNFYLVISEPGDCTRYDYFVYKDRYIFIIMPRESTFIFPQIIDYYNHCRNAENKMSVCNELAKKYNCNPYTVKEVIETCKILFEEYPL